MNHRLKGLALVIGILLGISTVNCGKETIVERVEVQKGTSIHSGNGVPNESLGNIGDYYLDIETYNLYGGKTVQGWGMPINLKGIPGKAGSNGVTPHIGSNGNWFVGETDTQVKAQGTPGIQGVPGISPHIGANGNWFVGDTDTHVKAQGETGATGADGIAPHIGANGNWYVGEIDTHVKAQGPRGA